MAGKAVSFETVDRLSEYMCGFRRFISLALTVILTSLANIGFAQVFSTVGNAVSIGQGCYVLTDGTSQKGAVWNPTTINLNNDFDLTFYVRQYKPGGGNAADGMAFVFHNSASSIAAIGGGGNGLGYGNTSPVSSPPITPSVGIELDTWGNSTQGHDDPIGGAHHTAIHIDGDLTTAYPTATAPISVLGGNIDDGICRPYRITWDASDTTLTVSYNGVLYLTYQNDLVTNVFGGNPNVIYGFTASSGGAAGFHQICTEFADAGLNDTICFGDQLLLNGAGGGTYVWNDTAGFGGVGLSCTNCQSPTFNPLLPVPVWAYELTVVNDSGCVDKDTVKIKVDIPVTPSAAGPDESICSADLPHTMQANNPVSGIGTWGVLNGSGVFVFPTDPASQLNGLTSYPDSNIYSWTICPTNPTNVCPCDTDTVVIKMGTTPTVDLSALPDSIKICEGIDTLLTGAIALGYNTLSWTPAAEVVDPDSLETRAFPLSSNWFKLTAVDSSGNCSAADSLWIELSLAPKVWMPLGDTFIVCQSDTVILVSQDSAGIGDVILWTPAAGLSDPTSANPLSNPDSSTNYIVTYTNSISGCSASDSAFVGIFTADISGLSDTTICRGDTLDLNPLIVGTIGFLTWTSSTGDWISDPDTCCPRVAPNDSASFELIVEDMAMQCGDTAIVTVLVQNITVTAAPPYTIVNPGHSVDLTSTASSVLPSPLTYLWTDSLDFNCPTCPDPTVTPTVDGSFHEQVFIYNLVVNDTFGCSKSIPVKIQVEADSLMVPNVFTPNGDGINDILMINYWGVQPYATAIYDRWGVKHYETTDPQVNWDGTSRNGGPAKVGIYYLVVEIKDDPAIPDFKKNDAFPVTLLR